jgi:hypothetical protein
MDLRQKIKFKKVVYGLLVTLVVLWYGGYIFVKIEEGRSKAIIGWIDDYYVDRGVLPDSLSQLGPKNFRGLTPGYYKVDDDRYVIYYRHSFENVVAWHSWRGKWENRMHLEPLDSTLLGYLKSISEQECVENVKPIYAVSLGDSLRIARLGFDSEYFDSSKLCGFIKYDGLRIAIFDAEKAWQNILYNPYFFEKEKFYDRKLTFSVMESDSVVMRTFSMPQTHKKLR